MIALLLACDAGTPLVAAWLDQDGDGYGDPATRIDAATLPVGYVPYAGDCDDADAGVYPGAPESCDTRDEDCDGRVDEEPVEPATWYLDVDGDGVGVQAEAIEGCPAPEGYAATDGDCDDHDPTRSPALPELCENGIDDDCSGGDARCGVLGSHSLSEADVKILGDQPERHLGASLRMGPDCVGAGTGSLLVFQAGTAGRSHAEADEIPAAWTVLAGADVHSQTLPGAGQVLTTETTTGLVAEDAAACLAGIGPGGGRALVLSAESDEGSPELGAVGFPAPIVATTSLTSAPLSMSKWSGDVSVFASGDTNGDGVAELIVSSDVNGEAPGYVLVYGASWDPADAIALLQPHSYPDDTAMGHSLCVSDLDGDGLDDIATGNRLLPGSYYAGWVQGGAVWIKYGPVAGELYLDGNDGAPDAADGLWLGDTNLEAAGEALTCKRDVTGDGLPDLLAGAHDWSETTDTAAGSAYLVPGPATGVHAFAEAPWIARAEAPEWDFGRSVTSDSDLDGDGLGDLVVAGGGADSTAGVTYIFYSGDLVAGTTSALAADATWAADSAGDNAEQLAGGADLDGDGFDDLAIGAYGDDTNGENAGAVYVIFGGLP